MHGIRLRWVTTCLLVAACGVSKSGLEGNAGNDAAVAGGGGTATGGRAGSGGSTGSGGLARTGGTTGGGGSVVQTGGATGPRDGSSDGATIGTGGARADAWAAADGPPTVIYVGCSYIGGIDRAVIARQDYETGMCTAVVLESPSRGRDADGALTVSGSWQVAQINLWPMGQTGCASRAYLPNAAHPISASGSITVDPTVRTISADVTLVFALDAGGTTTVVLDAEGVSLQADCDI